MVSVGVRRVIMASALAVFSLLVLDAMMSMSIDPGVSRVYNTVGVKVAKNMVTAILFDFRGYDTLGEAIILVTGVLAVSLLFGRGLLSGDVHEDADDELRESLVLRTYAPLLASLVVVLGVFVTLGGHITPGGGFQGGSIIASGMLLTLVVCGRGAVKISHPTLVKMEAAGVLLYLTLGILGLLSSGYFLYNLGVDLYGIVSPDMASIFNYPDGVDAGIVPYLNIAVLIKVSAGLTTVMLVLLGGKR
ncbi:MAG: hypothetical protein GF416_02040 [Candidatus Altiarchaeales archaeon]|nr:hypothetical protein [Candidatus Altiarchaeales archaeon]MBD3415898.1 hypothetical protein [Candidatus Altiarchaeales archaeon]